MNTAIESSTEVNAVMTATGIKMSAMLTDLLNQAHASPVLVTKVKQGIEIEVDFELIEVKGIKVDNDFFDFFREHKPTVLYMNIIYKMWELYNPGVAPTEQDLFDMSWPTKWVQEHMEFLESFSKKYN